MEESKKKRKRIVEGDGTIETSIDDGALSSDELPTTGYISPIAVPLLNGKSLDSSLSLVRLSVEAEKMIKSFKSVSSSVSDVKVGAVARKCIKRGVQEVTKALRKNEKGVVLLAADVYPVDVAAHIPIMCEETDNLYGFVTDKKAVADACGTNRPSSVIMINLPTSEHEAVLKMCSCNGKKNENNLENLFQSYEKLFKKASKSIKKIHPYI